MEKSKFGGKDIPVIQISSTHVLDDLLSILSHQALLRNLHFKSDNRNYISQNPLS